MTEYMTDRDVAAKFGISWQQVQERCKAGQWPHLRIGRRYRFTDTHVEQIAALSEVKPKEQPADTWGQKGRRSA